MNIQRDRAKAGFALAITLVLLALIAIVTVAYLASSRTERSTSSVYANRLRAQIAAESGLTAAIHVLKANTQYGNYVTAVPALSPSPGPTYLEIYRPVDSTSGANNFVKANDYLRLDNGSGEILVSRATVGSSPGPDPRPSPDLVPSPLPAASPFALPSPSPALVEEKLSPTLVGNSYNFNQIVRVGTTDGRLVQPSPTPSPAAALGQWVNVRNSSGDLVGRYAFFIEDESMKTDVNATANASPSPRPNDLASSAFPASQVQEIDATGILPTTANRATARTALTGAGVAGSRLSSKPSVALIDSTNWQTNYPSYAHMATVASRDDLTTARGWQRMDLNAAVAAATTDPDKVMAAQKIADWIRDAWTGLTPIGTLQGFQMLNDSRLRAQIGANIVDYIDNDNIPTDMGDVNGFPVLGIEKIPYLVEVDVVYAASDTSPPAVGRANISMSFRFNFFNMFETDFARLSDYVSAIKVKGVPVINKNGTAIFNHEDTPYTITVGSAAGPTTIPDGPVPWGTPPGGATGDNIASGVAGAKTFRTGTVFSEQVTYTPGGSATQLEAGQIEIDVIGPNNKRLDSTKLVLRDLQAKYSNASPQPNPNDFLEARQTAASINATYSNDSSATLDYGDPRYRPTPLTKRWYNLTRTDTTRFTQTATTGDDRAEMDCRAYSVDWYDYVGDRPLLFHRNGPMVSIGELGNISACEYPWRTLYLQYAGRPKNTNDTTVGPAVEDRRGSSTAAQASIALQPQDYVLVDLFSTSSPSVIRTGALNINSQFNIRNGSNSIDQGALNALFSGLPVGGGVPGGSNTSTLTAAGATLLSTNAGDRRSAVAPLAAGGPGNPGGSPPIFNSPRHPYFTIGELASDMSWMVNQSENTTTTGNGRSRTTINYSVLRATPASKSTWTRDYGTDMQVEEPFRKVSNSITTRGNVFRVLYVGESIRDINKSGQVDGQAEVAAEYLGEAFVERSPTFLADPSTPNVTKTSTSTYRVIADRVVTE